MPPAKVYLFRFPTLAFHLHRRDQITNFIGFSFLLTFFPQRCHFASARNSCQGIGIRRRHRRSRSRRRWGWQRRRGRPRRRRRSGVSEGSLAACQGRAAPAGAAKRACGKGGRGWRATTRTTRETCVLRLRMGEGGSEKDLAPHLAECVKTLSVSSENASEQNFRSLLFNPLPMEAQVGGERKAPFRTFSMEEALEDINILFPLFSTGKEATAKAGCRICASSTSCCAPTTAGPRPPIR